MGATYPGAADACGVTAQQGVPDPPLRHGGRVAAVGRAPSSWPEHGWTQVDGYRLHAAASGGTGRPVVVLVHGQGVSHRYLGPLARRLSHGARVVALDLPGFGLSPCDRTDLDVPDLAEAFAAWVQEAGLAGAVVVGHSTGCQVVVEAALRHPGLLGRLVLAGPTVDRRARTWAQQAGRLLADLALERPDLLLVLARDYARCGVRRYRQTFDHMLADRVEDKVGRLLQPVLLVRGSLDPVSPRAWNLLLLSRLVDGRLVELPWGGHNAGWSRPSAMARAVQQVVDDAVAAGEAVLVRG